MIVCVNSNGERIYCPITEKECNPNCALLSLPFEKNKYIGEEDLQLVCCTLSNPGFGDQIGLFELRDE